MWATIEKLRRRSWGMVTRPECSRSHLAARPVARWGALWYHPPSRLRVLAAPSPHRTPRFSVAEDVPHLDGRSHAVGAEARPPGRGPAGSPPASAQRREDARRQGTPPLDLAD